MNFADRHILITGASTGIGRATAALLVRRGARVSLLARRQEVLDEAVTTLGNHARGFAADVADKAALLGAIDAAEAAHGPLDGLFANAGATGNFAPLEAQDDDFFEAVLRTNLTSVFWALKRVLPGMVARGRGSVLVTGSLGSHRGMGLNVAYVASKHGLLGLARAAAMEAAPSGVRVNCIVPGFIDTPAMDKIDDDTRRHLASRVPQGRIGNADEMAEVAAFLLSDAASHVTGQSWAVDGGVLGTLAV